MRRALLIGQGPHGENPGPPLGGRIGKFLGGLVGTDYAGLEARFTIVNFSDQYRGKAKHGKGDVPPEPGDGLRNERFMHLLATHRVWVIFGKTTARAMGAVRPEYLRWYVIRDRIRDKIAYVILPHPSGIVRWWNDPKNKRKAAKVLRLAGAGEDEVLRVLTQVRSHLH